MVVVNLLEIEFTLTIIQIILRNVVNNYFPEQIILRNVVNNYFPEQM